jgi:hypothetical protein
LIVRHCTESNSAESEIENLLLADSFFCFCDEQLLNINSTAAMEINLNMKQNFLVNTTEHCVKVQIQAETVNSLADSVNTVFILLHKYL